MTSAEPRESWISSRIAHMLTCSATKTELLDEIILSNTDARLHMMAALRTILDIGDPRSPAFQRALGSIEALLHAQAQRRAEGEWSRLMAQDPPELEAA